MLGDKLLGLNKHASRPTTRVHHTAFKRLEHLHKELHNARGGVELSPFFHRQCKLSEEVFEDLSEDVGTSGFGISEGNVSDQVNEPPTLATSRFSFAYTLGRTPFKLGDCRSMESIAWSRSRPISGLRAWACKAAQRASWGTKKTFSALYSSESSGSAYGVS